MKVPIPDDWQEADDGYILGLVCIPNSQMWRSLVRGKIQELTRGRVWDEQTGIIKQAQAVGWAIYDSFMTCKLDDLVLAVENIGNFNEKLVFELARMNYHLDRIRDNLDSHAPDGEENTEYGLATLLAALGPNVTQSTEFIKAIKDALNTNLIGFPDETGDFAEGQTPALPDLNGYVTSIAAEIIGPGTLRITINSTGPCIVLLQFKGTNKTYYLQQGESLWLEASEGWDLTPGEVTIIDQKFNIFTDSF